LRLHFLGTGASGGTPGRGRSRRRESSLLVDAHTTRLLIDVTRHFGEQAAALEHLDAALLTHAHRDACGGMAALGDWWRRRSTEPLPVYASSETIAGVRRRFRRLDHCRFVAVRAGRARRIGAYIVRSVTVPHARERHYPTFAWRLETGDRSLVYASDVARLTPELERFSAGADVLVIDGAMWRRQLFSHLTIDRELPRVCRWRVGRILLTQIGRTAPPHERLAREARRLCPRAAPACDGLEVPVG
jgi:phosphoribosyl 1,2-cyclic phosphodiesterase